MLLNELSIQHCTSCNCSPDFRRLLSRRLQCALRTSYGLRPIWFRASKPVVMSMSLTRGCVRLAWSAWAADVTKVKRGRPPTKTSHSQPLPGLHKKDLCQQKCWAVYAARLLALRHYLRAWKIAERARKRDNSAWLLSFFPTVLIPSPVSPSCKS